MVSNGRNRARGSSVAVAEPPVIEHSKEELRELLYRMMLIRRFEEKAAEMYTRQKIKGFLHLYIGEEAVAVGAISRLREDDYIYAYYREHGQALARGLDANAVMAELFGKATGVSKGLGGSMHLFDAEKRFMGGYAIVGGQLPLAVGTALACKRLGTDSVVLCIFGDAAVNNGAFHESLNLAAIWKLPILFLCENNFYGMGTAASKTSAVQEVYKRASAFDIPAERVDGMDILEVQRRSERALQHVRGGAGPYLIEAVTYRYRGHSMADPELYRERSEITEWRDQDPIAAFADLLLRTRGFAQPEIEAVIDQVEREIDEAARFADESPFPDLSDLRNDIYAPSPLDHMSGGRI
jgi:pyruvate dehydrogenase E1 component alpha subunit